MSRQNYQFTALFHTIIWHLRCFFHIIHILLFKFGFGTSFAFSNFNFQGIIHFFQLYWLPWYGWKKKLKYNYDEQREKNSIILIHKLAKIYHFKWYMYNSTNSHARKQWQQLKLNTISSSQWHFFRWNLISYAACLPLV